jgi:protein-S-isoprenylcysteine O-methyltransferase Ste14
MINREVAMDDKLKSAIRKRLGQIGFLILVQAAIMFLAAGTLQWIEGWLYLIVYLGFIGANAIVVIPRNPGVIAERSEIKADAKTWDKIWGVASALLGPAILLIAGLDYRLNWTPPLGLAIQIAGGVAIVLGLGLFGWAFASNAFFSAVVRIQKDRGHTVQTGGPYRFVRHPAYAGMIVDSLGMPLFFDSLWAFIPALFLIGALIVRTALEDQTLQNELEGYKAFTQQTRFRLFPGIW